MDLSVMFDTALAQGQINGAIDAFYADDQAANMIFADRDAVATYF